MSCHQEHEHTFHDQQVVWKYHHLAATESVKNFDADYSHILGKNIFYISTTKATLFCLNFISVPTI